METAAVRLPGLLAACLAVASVAVATSVDAQVAVRSVEDTGAKSTVSAGGQVREQYEWFANEEWGAEVPDANGYWLQRYMFHLDAQLSRHVRLYGELKSGIEVGRAGGPRPPDEDHLDLHQGFVDLSFGGVTVRVGRQELAFGSQRLVSVREGPNMRQTFDAGKVVVQRGRWRVDGFGAGYVSTDPGVFDDSPDTGRALWGVYAVRSRAHDHTEGMDFYYLGYRRLEATFDQGKGREVRHSWGARFWRTSSPLDYNFEAVVQTGRFANTDIRAWTIASDTGYRMETVPGRPRLGLRADITSGDRDPHDDRLGTFNPMFLRGDYFGLISTVAPANHLDLHPQVTLNMRDDLVLNATWLFFWRNQVGDGIYGIPGNVLRSAEGTRSRFVGQSPGIEAVWQVTPHLSLTGNASLFTAGSFIQESGPASTIGYLAGWTTFRF